MKLKILTPQAEEKGTIELPKQFSEELRQDLIKRAVLAINANNRASYGAFPEAGKRASAILSKRRRKYKGMYGKGISRTPRKTLTRRGSQMYWVGAFAPQTVGGRMAHPPKASKIWEQKVNKKENRKAIRSAIAATLDKQLVTARGHEIPSAYPFIIDDSFESIIKTADVLKSLMSLGFEKEMERASKKKVRSGKGKNRGRKYKKAKSILIVTSKPCSLQNAAKNITGIDVAVVKNINALLLAPGAVPGRATLFTASAIKMLKENKLFM